MTRFIFSYLLLLQLLLFKFVLNIGTERHWTLLLLTVFGVVAA